MHIGLYNRHLATLGGGERHSLAIAAALAGANAVDVITHTPISRTAIAERLQIDLSAVALRIIPECSAAGLSALSGEYDFFINASNGDFIVPRSAYAALLVFFPTPPDHGPAAELRRYVGRELAQAFLLPQWEGGVYGEVQGVRRLGPTACVRQPAPSVAATLRFALRSTLPLVQQVTVAIDGSPVATLAVGPEFATYAVPLPPGGERRVVLRAAALTAGTPFALELRDWHVDALGQRAYQHWFAPRLPGWDSRLRNPQPPNLCGIAALYPLRWANSRFTQRWIERSWGLSSQLLYPPVDVASFAPDLDANGLPAKRQQILSVGRFFAGQHNKQHQFMVQAFQRLVDGGLRDWELHLVGGVTPGAEHAAYLNFVRLAAQGYPITVAADLPFDQLTRRYAEAAIYWHATGCQAGPDDHPIQAEHFGITTVEAMAAGCVPAVAARGGQPELITHGVDGWLWETQDELCAFTRLLIEEPARRELMAGAARAASRRFGPEAFRERLFATLATANIPAAAAEVA